MTEDGTQARGVIAVSIAVLLAGALLGSFIVHPDAVQQGNINLLIGALIGALSTIVGFYFGSSSGAKALVAAQSDIVKAAANVAPGNALSDAKPAGTKDDPVVTEDASAAPAAKVAAPKVTFADFRTSLQGVRPDFSEAMIAASWVAYQHKKTYKVGADDGDIDLNTGA